MKRFTMMCIFALGACNSPTASDNDGAPWLQGSWDYTAEQSSPWLQMNGTLTITEQVGNAISGSIDYIELDAAGIPRRRIELFNGRIRGGRSITIDAATDDKPRKHTGALVNDSIGGTFDKELTEGRLQGSFAARRR